MRTRTDLATPAQSAAIVAGRIKLGLSMNELARCTNGLSQGRIQKIVNGDVPFTARSRRLLEEVLGVLP